MPRRQRDYIGDSLPVLLDNSSLNSHMFGGSRVVGKPTQLLNCQFHKIVSTLSGPFYCRAFVVDADFPVQGDLFGERPRFGAGARRRAEHGVFLSTIIKE